MQILDRKTAPAFKTIEKIEIIKANKKELANQVPVYSINAGTQEILKLEFVFSAGKWYQSAPLIASASNTMLDEGTAKHTAAELADRIDAYGAFLEADVNPDFAYISLYTLNKHLKKTLPFIEEIIKNPTYPQNEFNTYIQNKKQKFQVDIKKVNYLARKKFTELIFGETHPYGNELKSEHFDQLTNNDLIDFHRNYYQSNRVKMILSGKVGDAEIDLINTHFGGNDWSGKEADHKISVTNPSQQKKHLIYKDDAIQSAIRIGKVLFNKTHPDYMGMQVLNTILGGYFGSRLMTNIREDKGYTYGIGSGIVSLQNAGYFFISTEVGVDVSTKTIDEIYMELNRLRNELIVDDELSLVRNYLLGAFLKSVDGPFALADKFKGIMEYGLDYDYFNKFIHTIKNITPETLRDLAIRYFEPDTMYELVAGKKQ